MWIFTDEGFLSVVAFDPKLDKQKRSRRQRKSWGKNPVLVRARLEHDIDQIRPYWSKLKIEKDDSADYEFRAVVPRNRWIDFMANKAFEIDYDSHFKEVAQARSPGGKLEANARHTAMMQVWSIMAKLQPDAPYSGSKWWTSYKDGKPVTGLAAASAGSFTSHLCPENITYSRTADNGETKYYRRWCDERNGHKGDHKYGTEIERKDVLGPKTPAPVKFSGSENEPKANESAIATHPYDSTNPFNMPDTVEDMCKELLTKSPEDICVDPATPYATYDLWARANEEYREPMTADEILDVLDELIEDYATVESAREQYVEAAHKFTAGFYADTPDFSEGDEKTLDTPQYAEIVSLEMWD